MNWFTRKYSLNTNENNKQTADVANKIVNCETMLVITLTVNIKQPNQMARVIQVGVNTELT